MSPIGSAVLTFIGYKQTDTKTNKQTDKPNLYIDVYSENRLHELSVFQLMDKCMYIMERNILTSIENLKFNLFILEWLV